MYFLHVDSFSFYNLLNYANEIKRKICHSCAIFRDSTERSVGEIRSPEYERNPTSSFRSLSGFLKFAVACVGKLTLQLYSNIIIFSKKWHIFHVINNIHRYWYKIPQPPPHKNWCCIVDFNFTYNDKMTEKYYILPYSTVEDELFRDSPERSGGESQFSVAREGKLIDTQLQPQPYMKEMEESQLSRLQDVKENSMFIIKMNEYIDINKFKNSLEKNTIISTYLFKRGKIHWIQQLTPPLTLPSIIKSDVYFLLIEYSHQNLKEPIPISLRNMHFANDSEILTPIFIYYYFKYNLGEAKAKEIYDESYTVSILDKNMNYVILDKSKYIYIAKSTYMIIKTPPS